MTREQIIEAMKAAFYEEYGDMDDVLTALETTLGIDIAALASGRSHVVDGGTLRDAVSCLRQNAQHMANTMDSPRANWMNNSADHLSRAMIEARKP